jgi:ATP-dependent DNA ligase
VRAARAVQSVMPARLPRRPPIAPMLAKLSGELPRGADGEWIYEPKWDGFRALVFKDGGAIYLQSRDEKPILRYFPELEAPLVRALPDACVLDGEIVIATGSRLDFDALLSRIHPAASRVAWEALRPELVCEVAYDHLQGTRFRHATTFKRWRPDKRPEDCRSINSRRPPRTSSRGSSRAKSAFVILLRNHEVHPGRLGVKRNRSARNAEMRSPPHTRPLRNGPSMIESHARSFRVAISRTRRRFARAPNARRRPPPRCSSARRRGG